MKKVSISLIALAAMALGACTSDDIALNENKAVGEGGDGYISLAINLPTTPSTRAANDNFDDGLPSEYAVNDATLLLFAGNDEASAIYYTQYALTTAFDMVGSSTDNITSRSQVTQKIDTPASGDIYALVVLNANGLLTEDVLSGATLKSLQSSVQNIGGASGMTSKGFFMCNAPLTSTPGGTGNSNVPQGSGVVTLAKIDAEKVFHTEEEAMENPAAEIYVERGVAKVTVETSDSYTSKIEMEDGSYLTVTVDGYALDLTNNVTYLVRNTTGNEAWWPYVNTVSGDHRMAGSSLVGSGLYRTYWAVDPNYDEPPYTTTDTHGNDTGVKDYGDGMNYLTGLDFTSGLGEEHPQYCLENTFDVAHMNQDETTRAIIKATFDTNGGDFFIWDKNHSVLYDYASIVALILNALDGNDKIEAAKHLYASTTDFYSHFSASLAEVADGTITEASDNATIIITVSGFTEDDFKPAEGETEPSVPAVCTQEGLAAVVESLNDIHTIGAYAGGVSYYAVMLKHFGDDLTPWDDSVMNASATDENGRSYPDKTEYGATAEEAWLGRYGVLRNNWYNISITSIVEPGSATPPEAIGRPDDPTDLYISIDINILSWARRTQSVEL